MWARVAWQQTTAALVQQPLASSSPAKVALRLSLSSRLPQFTFITNLNHKNNKHLNKLPSSQEECAIFQTFVVESLKSDLNDPDTSLTQSTVLRRFFPRRTPTRAVFSPPHIIP